MIKTPRGENARLILNVHLEHDTRKFYKNFILFSLDILDLCSYCKCGDHFFLPLRALPQCAREYYS